MMTSVSNSSEARNTTARASSVGVEVQQESFNHPVSAEDVDTANTSSQRPRRRHDPPTRYDPSPHSRGRKKASRKARKPRSPLPPASLSSASPIRPPTPAVVGLSGPLEPERPRLYGVHTHIYYNGKALERWQGYEPSSESPYNPTAQKGRAMDIIEHKAKLPYDWWVTEFWDEAFIHCAHRSTSTAKVTLDGLQAGNEEKSWALVEKAVMVYQKQYPKALTEVHYHCHFKHPEQALASDPAVTTLLTASRPQQGSQALSSSTTSSFIRSRGDSSSASASGVPKPASKKPRHTATTSQIAGLPTRQEQQLREGNYVSLLTRR